MVQTARRRVGRKRRYGQDLCKEESNVTIEINMSKLDDFHDKQVLSVPNISVVLSIRQSVGCRLRP